MKVNDGEEDRRSCWVTEERVVSNYAPNAVYVLLRVYISARGHCHVVRRIGPAVDTRVFLRAYYIQTVVRCHFTHQKFQQEKNKDFPRVKKNQTLFLDIVLVQSDTKIMISRSFARNVHN